MKILIADKLSEQTVADLQAAGLTVTVSPDLKAADLPEAIADHAVLVVRSTKVSAATIKAGGELALIVRAGAGVNTIDVSAASRRGIYVANCPGKNTAAVAELTIGLLIAADRQIVAATNALRNGQWRKKEFGKAAGLQGRVLGLIGFGKIAQAVAVRAKGLGMQVMAWSRSLTPERAEAAGVLYAENPLAVAGAADAVSLHVAAGAGTKNLVDKEFFAALKSGSILLNTARGEIVDAEALQIAIKEKGLRVGLDVYADEPTGGVADFPATELATMTTCTPHIGASTNEASEAVASEVVRIILAYLTSGRPPNVVNLCGKSVAAYCLLVRHYNRVGVLAGVLELLRAENVNVEEMENTIFADAQAACCSLLLDSEPSEGCLAELQSCSDVLQVCLTPR